MLRHQTIFGFLIYTIFLPSKYFSAPFPRNLAWSWKMQYAFEVLSHFVEKIRGNKFPQNTQIVFIRHNWKTQEKKIEIRDKLAFWSLHFNLMSTVVLNFCCDTEKNLYFTRASDRAWIVLIFRIKSELFLLLFSLFCSSSPFCYSLLFCSVFFFVVIFAIFQICGSRQLGVIVIKIISRPLCTSKYCVHRMTERTQIFRSSLLGKTDILLLVYRASWLEREKKTTSYKKIYTYKCIILGIYI